jgi:hypothetical protein
MIMGVISGSCGDMYGDITPERRFLIIDKAGIKDSMGPGFKQGRKNFRPC